MMQSSSTVEASMVSTSHLASSPSSSWDGVAEDWCAHLKIEKAGAVMLRCSVHANITDASFCCVAWCRSLRLSTSACESAASRSFSRMSRFSSSRCRTSVSRSRARVSTCVERLSLVLVSSNMRALRSCNFWSNSMETFFLSASASSRISVMRFVISSKANWLCSLRARAFSFLLGSISLGADGAAAASVSGMRLGRSPDVIDFLVGDASGSSPIASRRARSSSNCLSHVSLNLSTSCVRSFSRFRSFSRASFCSTMRLPFSISAD
mmetsp:Transcript_33893/g.66684  ORF Transcript_33893/g.66684 Transcript_33893/m.66684 type:complete len:266 (+) Transcript_33893:792-1589(+)